MDARTARRRIWGWMFFDWASQPYNTLLLTFVFAPYVKELMEDGSAAQAAWGYGVAAAGLVSACLAPVLGSIADRAGPRVRLRFLWLFSAAYVIGASALWGAAPGDFDLTRTLIFFGIGLIGMEFATTFTNAMLPDLVPRREVGRLSGTGWAFGYLGGLVALILTLVLLAESGTTGRTLIGIEPILGLDPDAREGTRAVGPFTALWYAAFMLPFFAWMRLPADPRAEPVGRALRAAWPDLRDALAALPAQRSLAAYLGASMLYRDGLNGLYFFGGIYAAGVLGWSVVDVGVFGIVAVIVGAVCAWAGGRIEFILGPKPVILGAIAALAAATLAAVFVNRDAVFLVPMDADSRLPDLVFYIIGAVIGGAGGILQASSRSMMVRQANPGFTTQGFGLYALSGKATAFLAPFAVATATAVTGSQQLGILPLLVLFLAGALLLFWVEPDGEHSP